LPACGAIKSWRKKSLYRRPGIKLLRENAERLMAKEGVIGGEKNIPPERRKIVISKEENC